MMQGSAHTVAGTGTYMGIVFAIVPNYKTFMKNLSRAASISPAGGSQDDEQLSSH
jgi:hypothetical protein